MAPVMGAEDFSFMLKARPGAFIFVGNGDSAGLHHPAYNFNDEVIPFGTSYWVKLVETALAGLTPRLVLSCRTKLLRGCDRPLRSGRQLGDAHRGADVAPRPWPQDRARTAKSLSARALEHGKADRGEERQALHQPARRAKISISRTVLELVACRMTAPRISRPPAPLPRRRGNPCCGGAEPPLAVRTKGR